MNQPIRQPNYSAGEWREAAAGGVLQVDNPATGKILAAIPLSGGEDVDQAVGAAHAAFAQWRRTPSTERVQYLFRLKALLEEQFEPIARQITEECGKTLTEARGELRRGIENVEVAAGIPSLMMGYNLEDIAPGIDETLIRQPLGVVAAITPFNFPAMIPLWFLPYALACGNTFVLKPSEKVPLTMARVFEILHRLNLPPGVVNLVHGSREAVEALLEHPTVRAVSFVGSSPVARHVYATAAARGKRVQCQGGAKNPVVILPDADMEAATTIVADSAFGCAGQRCLATSFALLVGEAAGMFEPEICRAAAARRVGSGLDEGIEMGPVISRQSKERIEGLIGNAVDEGAQAEVDGRRTAVPGFEGGYFLRPTVLSGVDPTGLADTTEVFGPVLALSRAADLDQAIQYINRGRFGNMASIFTRDGAAARKFRYEVQAGNIGVNVGVAAPMAFFPFSGAKESFFGDLHGQGRDAVDFYTEKKVVVERWPPQWSRRF